MEILARTAAATRRYGPVIALDGVSLDVPVGPLLGFPGPNSAGPSAPPPLPAGPGRPAPGLCACHRSGGPALARTAAPLY